MTTLVIGGLPQTLEIINYIQSFHKVVSCYSPYFTQWPAADFTFGLRYDRIDQIPWKFFDFYIDCSGSVHSINICLEQATLNKKPCFAFDALSQQMYFQQASDSIKLDYFKRIPLFKQNFEFSNSLFSYLNPDTIPHSFAINQQHITKIPEKRTQNFYSSGIQCDLVATACSEDTSAVAPSEERNLDLLELGNSINQSGYAKLVRVSKFFSEFCVGNKKMMIYRQGRLTLNPCLDAEEIYFHYLFFVGA
ncbi:hypothetical protein SAMN02745150_01282 [Brevinema andersonii]|uniref:Uncharacterized protein n=1 Tax=Brevinema andersonii TaxID=34097 RepID=A0A1I1EV59_BREAD|nr:hypothetical protein [Brevinema andersonii]SFB90994.1 hypothetical protein SAMN02745150_01282 [Brevinema andersonii]